jgi:hypothetical protein
MMISSTSSKFLALLFGLVGMIIEGTRAEASLRVGLVEQQKQQQQ